MPEREAIREDVRAMEEARDFFRSFGLPIESDGLVSPELTGEQVAKLKEWRNQTMEDSIDMPTEALFYEKTLLAVSLWRQQEGQTTNYLMGKGVGTEIALRGNVLNREKRNATFPYRSHSDFELYGVNYQTDEHGQNISKESPYGGSFRDVFGGQEYFPPTKTKGLKNLPPTLLHETAETVDLGGVDVLIPQLELLFLDKFMSRESTPRPEGYDAEVLAKQYVLDRGKVHQYLDQLVIEPAKKETVLKMEQALEQQCRSIKKKIASIAKILSQEGKNIDAEALVSVLNEQMQSVIGIKGKERNSTSSGISVRLWEDLKPDQVDDEGNVVDQKYLEDLQGKITELETNEIEKYEDQHQKIDALFDQIDS